MATEFLRQMPQEADITLAIIVPRYRGQWVFCRHKDRTGWEFPGGHKEPGETVLQTAKRELYEETGITDATFSAVSACTVGKHIAMLYFAEVAALGQIPEGSEIAETMVSALLPENCTYPNLFQFYDHVQGWLNLQTGADELWDLFDGSRKPTGRLQRRGDPIAPGDYHIVVHIWVRRPDGRFLLTKRSPNKGFPNLWETTGGSALAGDDSLTAALREVREETGLILQPQEGVLVETRKWIDHFDDIWLFQHDFSLAEVQLLEGETCDAMAATAEEILQLAAAGQFVPTERLAELIRKLKVL